MSELVLTFRKIGSRVQQSISEYSSDWRVNKCCAKSKDNSVAPANVEATSTSVSWDFHIVPHELSQEEFGETTHKPTNQSVSIALLNDRYRHLSHSWPPLGPRVYCDPVLLA